MIELLQSTALLACCIKLHFGLFQLVFEILSILEAQFGLTFIRTVEFVKFLKLLLELVVFIENRRIFIVALAVSICEGTVRNIALRVHSSLIAGRLVCRKTRSFTDIMVVALR